MTGEQFITQKIIQKFRAWGRDGNYPGTPSKIFEMFYDVSVVTTYDDKKQHVIADFGMYNESDYSGTKIIDYILMRFTGLFDKNGKEIFESDILKCTSFDGSLWYETVSWDSTLAGFATQQDGHDATAISYITDSKVITIEVIGDIYQNPELAEE